MNVIFFKYDTCILVHYFFMHYFDRVWGITHSFVIKKKNFERKIPLLHVFFFFCCFETKSLYKI